METTGFSNLLEERQNERGNFFFIPPDTDNEFSNDLVLDIGSTLDVAWTTNLTTFELQIYQQFLNCSECVGGPVTIASPLSNESFPWVVSTEGLDLADSPVFYLAILDPDNPDTEFDSSYFNLTGGFIASSTVWPDSVISITSSSSISPTVAPSTTQSTSTAVITPTPSGSTTATSTSSQIPSLPTSTSTATASKSTSGGLSPNAKIGLGAGLAVAGAIAVVLLYVLYVLTRRKPHKRKWMGVEMANANKSFDLVIQPTERGVLHEEVFELG